MKRISVEVEKTVKVNEKRWEAIDGTVFDDYNAACEYEDGYRDGLITRLGMKRIHCPLVLDKHGISSLDDYEQFIWLPKSTDDIGFFFTTFLHHREICWGAYLGLVPLEKVIITLSEEDESCGIDLYDDVLKYAMEQVEYFKEIGAMV